MRGRKRHRKKRAKKLRAALATYTWWVELGPGGMRIGPLRATRKETP